MLIFLLLILLPTLFATEFEGCKCADGYYGDACQFMTDDLLHEDALNHMRQHVANKTPWPCQPMHYGSNCERTVKTKVDQWFEWYDPGSSCKHIEHELFCLEAYDQPHNKGCIKGFIVLMSYPGQVEYFCPDGRTTYITECGDISHYSEFVDVNVALKTKEIEMLLERSPHCKGREKERDWGLI